MNYVILEEMKGELGCSEKPIIRFDQHKKLLQYVNNITPLIADRVC